MFVDRLRRRFAVGTLSAEDGLAFRRELAVGLHADGVQDLFGRRRPLRDIPRRLARAARIDPGHVTGARIADVEVYERAVRIEAASSICERLAERDDLLVLRAFDT